MGIAVYMCKVKLVLIVRQNIFDPVHWILVRFAMASSLDSDEPLYPCSLTRTRAANTQVRT